VHCGEKIRKFGLENRQHDKKGAAEGTIEVGAPASGIIAEAVLTPRDKDLEPET
jgi:hypothetical protein